MTLWSEIVSQSDVLGTFTDRQASATAEIGSWISKLEFSHVVLAARGSSDNAARYAQYLWGAHNSLSVALAAPSLYTLYDSPPRLDDSLVVGVSQSGESPDLLAVLKVARQQGRPVLAITNNPSSPMAGLADRHLDIGAGPELAVAATKTYTSQLMAVAGLSAAMSGDKDQQNALDLVAPAVRTILEGAEAIAPLARLLEKPDRCVTIGRGYNHSTAFEWALKVTELSRLAALPYSAADFRHGPLALVEPGLPVLAVATDGPLYDDVSDLISVVRRLGAFVLAITDRPDCPADELITIPPVPEWLTPIPATVAAQVFTYHVTVARGLDPDSPRSISKVTRTT